MTEEIEKKLRDALVKKASSRGMVSFCTRGYGRGMDFICNDKNVDKEGGVHVILTFKPEDVSEEIQIMGRTAR
jgi:preprotein translocase subunit SecA